MKLWMMNGRSSRFHGTQGRGSKCPTVALGFLCEDLADRRDIHCLLQVPWNVSDLPPRKFLLPTKDNNRIASLDQLLII
jgi:hypothetical protein